MAIEIVINKLHLIQVSTHKMKNSISSNDEDGLHGRQITNNDTVQNVIMLFSNT